MPEAWFRFHAALSDFLPPGFREQWFAVRFSPGVTVKNAVEARGVPHTEVELVTANGIAVPLSYRLREDDRIEAYPFSTSADVPGEGARFVLDVHLGKLARDLRALGFDAAWEPPFDDGELAACAAREGRILLTRDRALLMRRSVTAGYLVRSQRAPEQLLEVVRRFGLEGHVHPFGRCLICNGELAGISREEARPEVPPRVCELYDEFRRCQRCRRVFWKGTHWDDMARRLAPFLGRMG